MTAAAARKLQKDIEVALKKVDEGIEEFDDVWDRATSSSNSSQKEKLGEELKKSISKLQRLRVQIREWIGQSDVKSNLKDKLEDTRKRIEADMQRFKEFERDLKTKAFSACALAKGDELELEEAEKRKYQDWLIETIHTLQSQLEEDEADLEILMNKKSHSNDDKDRISQMKTLQDRHNWHVKKLELILRGLDNDAVDCSDLAIVRDSVETYLDCHHDPDYYHDEQLYDCFDLHEAEESSIPRTPSMDVTKADGTPGGKEEPKQKVSKEKDKRKKEDKKDKKKEEKKAATPQNATGGASNKSGANSGRNSDAKTPTAGLNGEQSGKEKRLDEPVEEEECKVSADQLLLGGEAEEFVCKICQTHVVGCGPTLTNCSHLFCGDCLGQWFAQHPESQTWAQRAKAAGPDRVVPCPVCKQPLNEKRDLYPVCGATSRSENLLLWRMLSSLKIMCINHSRMKPYGTGKCDWIGEYGQYQKHYKQCESQQLEGSSSSPRPSTPAAAPTPVCTPCPAPAPASPAPLRAPSESRRSDGPSSDGLQSDVVEKSPAHGATAPERSPHGAAGTPAPPQGQSAPARTQPAATAKDRDFREQQRHEASKSAPAVASPAPAVPAATAEPLLVPVADEPAPAPAPEAAAPQATAKAPQAPQRTPPGASTSQATSQAQAQPAVQANAQAQPQAQQPQSRKAPAPSQEPDGSFTTQATSAFEPTGPNMVQAQVGDTILVLERHASGWTYCKNLSSGNGSITGWAPSWIVQPAAVEASSRKARAKDSEPSATPAPAPAPSQQSAPTVVSWTSPAKSQDKESSIVSSQTSKVELRSTQPAVAAAPTPQHAQAQSQPLRSSAEAPSTVVRVATSGFNGASTSQLTVNTGDLVEIVESHASGWTYGRKVHTPQHFMGAIEGWFPDWVCAQK